MPLNRLSGALNILSISLKAVGKHAISWRGGPRQIISSVVFWRDLRQGQGNIRVTGKKYHSFYNKLPRTQSQQLTSNSRLLWGAVLSRGSSFDLQRCHYILLIEWAIHKANTSWGRVNVKSKRWHNIAETFQLSLVVLSVTFTPLLDVARMWYSYDRVIKLAKTKKGF